MRIVKKKAFDELIYIVDIRLDEISRYFTGYNILFETKAKEMKQRSYGGFEVHKLLAEFSRELDKKTTILLKEIENIIISSSRRISNMQIGKLTDKCIQKINVIIEQYYQRNNQVFGSNETIELLLIKLKRNTEEKIRKDIRKVKAIINIKEDKTLKWTIIGVIVALIPIVASIIKYLICRM